MDYQIEIKDIGLGCFEATSPQYKGFSATGPSKEEVEDKLNELIQDSIDVGELREFLRSA